MRKTSVFWHVYKRTRNFFTRFVVGRMEALGWKDGRMEDWVLTLPSFQPSTLPFFSFHPSILPFADLLLCSFANFYIPNSLTKRQWYSKLKLAKSQDFIAESSANFLEENRVR